MKLDKAKAMKAIIQIPCLNEEENLPATLKELPRKLTGIDEVKWLVVDDGSRDDTVKIAIENGVDYIISHPNNKGLAQSFITGLEACLYFGADIIINTDADNQYFAGDIQKLVDPIIKKEADYVIGARPIAETTHFSPLKKVLQSIGSRIVRFVSKTNVTDAPSGFRAISRKAAMRLQVFNNYTYTLETIIQAGRANIKVVSVPIRTNPQLRESRLISSIPNYIFRSAQTIIRSLLAYDPFKFFVIPSMGFIISALGIGFRFLYFYFIGNGDGHIQSLIFGTILFVLGGLLFATGLLSDLISVNRKLLERTDYKIRTIYYENNGHTPKSDLFLQYGEIVYIRQETAN